MTEQLICVNETDDVIECNFGDKSSYWEPSEPSFIVDMGKETVFNRVTIWENADANKEETIHIL